MPEIIKTEIQQLPEVKLIGRCYTDRDRNAAGTFSDYWRQWFRDGLFDKLCGEGRGLRGISDDYVGLCRCTGNGFEYWIGVLMAPEDAVLEGYESLSLGAGRVFVCYLRGREETGELYGEAATRLCFDEMLKQGCTPIKPTLMYERYNCPRYTDADSEGRVILDYCIFAE